MTLRCRVTCKGTLGWVVSSHCSHFSVRVVCSTRSLLPCGKCDTDIQSLLLSPPQMHLSVKVLIGLCCLGATVMAQAQYDGDLYAEASQDSSVYTPNRLG